MGSGVGRGVDAIVFAGVRPAAAALKRRRLRKLVHVVESGEKTLLKGIKRSIFKARMVVVDRRFWGRRRLIR